MKKIFLTLLLLIPAFLINAQGPIKLWNDQLDAFIETFNQSDPALEQLYSGNGIDTFTYTYFEPDYGNVVKEATIASPDEFNKVSDDIMARAKAIVTANLADAAKNSKFNTILNEFSKRNTDIILLYTTEVNGQKLKKQLVISPSELKSSK